MSNTTAANDTDHLIKQVVLTGQAKEAYEFNGSKPEDTSIYMRTQNILERYASILATTDHGLSDEEMNAVHDAHWGHAFTAIEMDADLHVNVAHYDGDLEDKWGIDQDALVEKLQGLTQAQRVVIVELIERGRAERKAGRLTAVV